MAELADAQASGACGSNIFFFYFTKIHLALSLFKLYPQKEQQ